MYSSLHQFLKQNAYNDLVRGNARSLLSRFRNRFLIRSG